MDRWKKRGILATTVLSVVMSLASLAAPFSSVAEAATPSGCAWTDKSTIKCGSKIFTNGGSGTKFNGPVDGSSFARIDINPPNFGSGDYMLTDARLGRTTKAGSVSIANPEIGSGSPTPTPTTSPAPTGSGSDTPTCDIGSLTWIFCPLISLAQSAVDYFSNLVKDLLNFPPLTQNSPTKAVWAAFRDIADVLFVLIFMVVIFGTGLGMDSYTVKKIMPRLIAAAVMVQFSYIIVGIGVDISNVAGKGIDALFATLPIAAGAPTGESLATNVVGGVEAAVGTGAVLWVGFSLGLAVPLILTILSAVIGLLVIFVTLEVRLLLINFLIIIAPFAFILYVLPNTQRYFKMWHQTLFKLLLMYPLIVTLLAASKLVSATIPLTDSSSIQKLIAATIPIIAFFAIPATFKFAGSALGFAAGKIGSMGANRAQKGISGMQSKMSENRAFNRKQNGIDKLAQLEKMGKTGGLSRRVAQHQAGFGIDSMNPIRTYGAIDSHEKTQIAARSREFQDLDASQLSSKVQSGNEYERRAAIGILASKSEFGKLTELFNDQNGRYKGDAQNKEWIQATKANYGDITSAAPHLTKGYGAYDSLSPAALANLKPAGVEGINERNRQLQTSLQQATASGDSNAINAAQSNLDRFATNLQSSISGIDKSATLPNSMRTDTREQLSALGFGTIKEPGGVSSNAVPDPILQSRTPNLAQTSLNTTIPVTQVVNAGDTIIEQKELVQQVLNQHAVATGQTAGAVENKYFTDSRFKLQVDTAHANGMSLEQLQASRMPHNIDLRVQGESDHEGDSRSIT